MKFNHTIIRDVRKLEAIHTNGASGHRTIKVGQEILEVEVIVDQAKLMRALFRKIYLGQNRTTLADGAVVARVISKTPKGSV